jgi:23S rRNA-/tRNA-specific pseudouridylate synthase
LQAFPEHTLLKVHPITGRTHQIRLHMLFINCPVAGDTLYGRRGGDISLNRLFLHAIQLQIQLPEESNPRTFRAPLPVELEEVLTELRENN